MKKTKYNKTLTHGYGSTTRLLSLSKCTTGSRGLATLILTLLLSTCGDTSTTDLLNGEFVNKLADTSPPTIITPLSGATTGLSVPLQWTSKDGASSYTIEVATDSAFTNQITGSPFTVTSASMVLPLFEGNFYYWRVRANTTEEGQYGEGTFNALDSVVYVYCPSTHAYCSDTDIHADGTNIIAVGHKAGPYRTIAGGIAEAVRLGKSEVRIAGRGDDGLGNSVPYTETIIIKDGVSVTGGYDSAFTAKDTSAVANQVVIESASSYVAYAQGVTRTTVVDSISFVNTSIGLSASYGVIVEGSNANLLFNNIQSNGGTGASAYGFSITNYSQPQIKNSSITTGNSSVKAVGIWNDFSSLPTLDSVAITTGLSTVTVGILNQPGSNSGVIMTNSSIVTSDATDYSVGIGGINTAGGYGEIQNSSITTGMVSLGAAYGMKMENGFSLNNKIVINKSGTYYGMIEFCNSSSPVFVNISQNLLSSLSSGSGKGVHVCNHYSADIINITENTISIGGTFSKGIEVGGNAISNSGITIKNNIVYENGISLYDSGISLDQTNVSSIDNNLIFNMHSLAEFGKLEYSSICDGYKTASTEGTFGGDNIANLTIDHGLFENKVYDVAASTDGSRLYVASHTGLSISTDGGISFVHKTTAEGLPVGLLRHIAVKFGATQSTDKVYLATENGLAISIDGGNSWSIKTVDNTGSCSDGISITLAACNAATAIWTYGMKNNYIWDVVLIPGADPTNDVLYLATAWGLSISLNGGSNWTTKGSADGLGSSYNYAVSVIAGGTTETNTIYASTRGGISVSGDNGATWVTYTVANGLPSDYVYHTEVGASGRLYAATFFGLGISNDNGATWVTKGISDGLPAENIRSVSEINNVVYAASWGGGIGISGDFGNTWSKLQMKDGLGSNLVENLFFNGTNIYISTYDGLSILSSPSFSFSTVVTGLASNNLNNIISSGTYILASAFDVNGALLISSDQGATWVNKTMADGLQNNNIYDVFSTGSEIYAISHKDAVSSQAISKSIDKGTTWNIRETLGLYSSFGAGNLMYFGGYSGLYISNDGGSVLLRKTEADGLAGAYNEDVFMRDNIIYAGGVSGLSVSRDMGQVWQIYTSLDGLGSSVIQGIFAKNNSVYLGTAGGASISLDNGESWVNYTTINGLGSDDVKRIVSYGSTLYAATSNGMAVSVDNGASWKNYTTTDGLSSNILRDIFVNSSGIYMATANGITMAQSNAKCNSLLSNSDIGNAAPGFPTGNKTAVYTTDVFDTVNLPVYDPLDPATWRIKPNGPADLDASGGWTTGDIGADATSAGVPKGLTTGAGW
ncbi:MAG: hypothetical protein OEZ13_03635 [Spirochaetia bacterium]|nr:hypothetical protein [Spirochaetia bacterium]